MNPLVSIIIPNYNRANLIGETLDSVLAQTYTNWECIIVDDGSTDNSKEVIQSYVDKDARFQLHDRPADRPKGANACRNYGFELSKGEYINWFDSDDVMLPMFLFEKINKFNESISMVICSAFSSDNLLSNRIYKRINIESNIFKSYITGESNILTPSILFRKKMLNNLNLFSVEINVGQETEFFSRIFINTRINDYTIINKPLLLYRRHQQSKTARNYKKYINKNKESQSFILIENFKRSFIIKDKPLINTLYNSLFHYLFLSVENRHYSNAKYIISNMFSVLWKLDKKLFFRFLIFDICYKGLKRYASKIKKI